MEYVTLGICSFRAFIFSLHHLKYLILGAVSTQKTMFALFAFSPVKTHLLFDIGVLYLLIWKAIHFTWMCSNIYIVIWTACMHNTTQEINFVISNMNLKIPGIWSHKFLFYNFEITWVLEILREHFVKYMIF